MTTTRRRTARTWRGCGRTWTEAEPRAAGLATGPYHLVNVSAGYSLTRGARVHSITLRADNLLDERHRDAASRIKDFAENPGGNLAIVYRLLF